MDSYFIIGSHGDINGAIGAFKSDAPDLIFPNKEQAMLSINLLTSKDSNCGNIKVFAEMRIRSLS